MKIDLIVLPFSLLIARPNVCNAVFMVKFLSTRIFCPTVKLFLRSYDAFWKIDFGAFWVKAYASGHQDLREGELEVHFNISSPKLDENNDPNLL